MKLQASSGFCLFAVLFLFTEPWDHGRVRTLVQLTIPLAMTTANLMGSCMCRSRQQLISFEASNFGSVEAGTWFKEQLACEEPCFKAELLEFLRKELDLPNQASVGPGGARAVLGDATVCDLLQPGSPLVNELAVLAE